MKLRGRGPLRILYVGTLPPHHGGSAIMAGQLLAGLAALGHQIEAISPITERELSAGDQFAGRNPALTMRRFTMPYLDISPDVPPSPDYVRRERAEIERIFESSVARRADVVLIGRESFAPFVVALARRQRLATVLLVQGATTNGILRGTYPEPEASLLLEQFRRVGLVVASAEHMRATLTGLGLANVEVIPNPVDLARFRPLTPSPTARVSLGVGEGDLLVTHPSNLKPIKRAEDFVDAAAIAAAEERRLSFLVVGDGPCRQALEERSTARGIGGRVQFTGWVDHDQMPEVINCSDIVALPSAGEAQALVYLEAQACESTLVASDIPAAREVIEDGLTGLLHRPADPSDLAATILMAARDPEFRRRVGRTARATVGEHALEKVVSRYSELLRAVATRVD